MQQPGATIIVVEDHAATRTFLADNLTADGFELLEAGNARDALSLMARARPDLALVDLGLPDADGLELVRTVRAADRAAGEIDPELPLLILSGRTGELDRLRAFDRGVDDYLAKPFSYPELRMRIAALLRRTAARPGRGRLRAGPLEVDPISRRVELAGRPVVLSKKEFALLRALAEEPTRVYTREELLMGVWGYRASGKTRR